MNKTRKILIVLFVYLLPTFILIDILCMSVTWDAAYSYEGGKYFSNYCFGFPLIDNGIFADINSMVTSGNTTTSLANLIINKLFCLALTLIIYFFLIKKISFESKTRIIILTIILTVIYLRFTFPWLFYHLQMIEYQYGVWPDEIDTNDISFRMNIFKFIFMR